jgi:hypothetical protein
VALRSNESWTPQRGQYGAGFAKAGTPRFLGSHRIGRFQVHAAGSNSPNEYIGRHPKHLSTKVHFWSAPFEVQFIQPTPSSGASALHLQIRHPAHLKSATCKFGACTTSTRGMGKMCQDLGEEQGGFARSPTHGKARWHLRVVDWAATA